ncbi:type IV pilus assembly protein PilY1 [Tahibacter aquaticus]|uniref:Type IV pilus assembly protein PilY1 n=1 Tax=Tahibacter aquaticus TaxID=520092 RepID=A0A4R6Z9I2_9GAMM|nr:PilC/PilY family type IV pilus protein [Tahibacter aquaticus]TDR48560.1 type IV pilus assembly protein PilY1 [Tahibacter aquaticus]
MRLFNRLALRAKTAALVLLAVVPATVPAAPTQLSDVPVFSASTVPANLMLALSVEFPTGQTPAYQGAFSASSKYLGYFDNTKCYDYLSGPNSTDNYFSPVGTAASGLCPGRWSGNLLNWATMTGLDAFRQALTGGNRLVDSNGVTILQRSRLAIGTAPVKSAASLTGLFPPTLFPGATTLYFRGSNGATQLSNGADSGVFVQIASNANFTGALQLYVRVRACEAAGGRESNCIQYPNGNWKPVGLIQRYADRVRVGAAGYLFRDGAGKPNGALRAVVRDVGPTRYNGLAPRSSNPNAEWNENTGIFVVNPDAASASAYGDGVSANSGSINYLNKFGYSGGYNSKDTLAGVYWTGLAHLMQVPLDARYAPNNANVVNGKKVEYDGFPVIPTTASDPMQYTCQGNAIVMIGDSHTWCDSAIPSSGFSSNGLGGCSGQAPLAPVGSLDAAVFAKAAGQLPLLEANSGNSLSPTAAMYLPAPYLNNLGGVAASTGHSSGYGVVGMAYYAHTQDIRANVADKQLVDTFSVDVLEAGPADGSSTAQAHFNPAGMPSGPGPSQYWLAAKYGGFDDINDNGIPANYRTWHTNSSNSYDTVPDNWFAGNRPDLVQSGLSTIFNRVASRKVLSAAGPGAPSSRSLSNMDPAIFRNPAPGFALYTTAYKPGDWSGNVTGAVASVAANGNTVPVTAGTPPLPVQWNAQALLDTMSQLSNGANPPVLGWNTTRRIVTIGSAGGIPFRYANLTTAQKAALNNDATLLDFLRGDRSRESTSFRLRKSVLGDIVNSKAVLVQAAQSPGYSETANPGYPAFRLRVASRAPVAYVAANDGMLHAFGAGFAAPAANGLGGGGSELFAYVPGLVFQGPDGTPQVSGLAALGNLAGVTANTFSHRFYVDQSPAVADADFNRVAGNAGGSGLPDWRTLLVGALGKGGKGVYALDVTDVPAAPALNDSAAQEAVIKNKVLWEFSDPDMGFLYGKPLIAKTYKYGWVVLVASGYNNSSGVGKLFVLNARTGALLETLATTGGSAASPSGLSRPSAYTKNFSDNTIEQVYAGDLNGKLWRFDLSAPTGAYPPPQVLATLTAPDGSAQPITTAPRIELDVDSTGLSTRRWVFVGTGQFLDATDLLTAQRQSLYALRDGNQEQPACHGSGTCPSLSRGQLIANTDLLAGVSITDASNGWYYDLTGQASAGGATERIVVDLDTQAGLPVVAWATLLPGTDPCNFQGKVYAANFATGITALIGAGGSPVANFVPATGAPTEATIYELPGGGLGLLIGSLVGNPITQLLNPNSAADAMVRINWREVLD